MATPLVQLTGRSRSGAQPRAHQAPAEGPEHNLDVVLQELVKSYLSDGGTGGALPDDVRATFRRIAGEQD